MFKATLGSTNVDKITDFSVTDDTIRLENSVFMGLVDGTLTTSAFQSNSTGLAGDATGRIIYETDTGNLYFDADGTAYRILYPVCRDQSGVESNQRGFPRHLTSSVYCCLF